MKSRNHEISSLRYKISHNSDPNKYWSLNFEQREYLESLGFEIIPMLYKISTRKLNRVFEVKSKLMKELHYDYKKGKRYVVKKLSKAEVSFLKERGYSVVPVKYAVR